METCDDLEMGRYLPSLVSCSFRRLSPFPSVASPQLHACPISINNRSPRLAWLDRGDVFPYLYLFTYCAAHFITLQPAHTEY